MSGDPSAPGLCDVSNELHAEATAPLDQARERFGPVELPKVFARRDGPPRRWTRSGTLMGGGMCRGGRRIVVLGRGMRPTEEITLSTRADGAAPENDRAQSGYPVSGFSGSLGLTASEARRERASIAWRLAAVATGRLARPALSATFWRAYTGEGLRTVVRDVERTR